MKLTRYGIEWDTIGVYLISDLSYADDLFLINLFSNNMQSL